MRLFLLAPTVLCGFALSTVACSQHSNNATSSSSSSSGSSGESSSGSTTDDGGTEDGQAVFTCQNDPRVDAYVANLTKTSTSGAFKVILAASDPAPPIVGTNTWTIRATDGSGAAMAGAPIGVATWMPDHGHTSSVRAVVTPQQDGSYTVTPIYFMMGGVWRITFSLPSTDAGVGESVEFFFCVTG